MYRFATLQVYVEQHQRWPSVESDLDWYEWVLKQQLLLVHGDTPDDNQEVKIEELEKVGIDWENKIAGRTFIPTTGYKALHMQM